MSRQLLEHVIEEANARRNGRRAGAVDIDGHREMLVSFVLRETLAVRLMGFSDMTAAP